MSNKAIIDSIILNKELKTMSPLISKRAIVPILSGVKFDFLKKEVKISASNFDMTIVATLPCSSKSEFSFVVEHYDLYSITSMFAEPITLEVVENSLKISSDDSNFKIPITAQPEHFPALPIDEWRLSIDVDGSFFFALHNASLCASKNTLLQTMVCPCIDIKKDKIIVVGTDSLMLYKIDFSIKTKMELQVMIPVLFVSLTKQLQDAKIHIGEKFILVESGNSKYYGRLHDAKFVSYEFFANMPRQYNLEIEMADLKSALVKVKPTAYEATGQIEVEFEENKMNVSSSNFDFGKEGNTSVASKHSVTIPSISFNGNLMQHLLGFLNTQTIEASITAHNESIFFKPKGSTDTLCLVQPLFNNQ